MRFRSVAHFFVHNYRRSVGAEELFDDMEESGISRTEVHKQIEELKDDGYLQVESCDGILIKPLKDRKEFKKRAIAEDSKNSVRPLKIIRLKNIIKS